MTMEKFDVKVNQREPVRGAALRLEGEITEEKIGLLWGRLFHRCEGIPSLGPAFGLRHENLYEACWAIPPGILLPEGLSETEAPGGWFAATVHEGAYDTLDKTVEKILQEWLPHSGFRQGDRPLIENYLNDPRETTEENLRTEVCLPLRPDPIE